MSFISASFHMEMAEEIDPQHRDVLIPQGSECYMHGGMETCIFCTSKAHSPLHASELDKLHKLISLTAYLFHFSPKLGRNQFSCVNPIPQTTRVRRGGIHLAA